MIKLIRHKRLKIGLSESELAKRLDINKSYLSRLERKVKGYNPSLDLIKRISKELKCCPIELFVFFTDTKCSYFNMSQCDRDIN
jgi:transcriptional regulator with XRE-family HTH domain